MPYLLAWENILTVKCLRVLYGKRYHYMLNISSFSEIFTTKRSQKDLHIKDIKSRPSPILDIPLLQLLEFFLCTVLVELISYNNGCSESCNLSCSLVVYPICTWKKKSFVFHFSVLTLLCLFSYHLHTCWCHLYSITQKYLCVNH